MNTGICYVIVSIVHVTRPSRKFEILQSDWTAIFFAAEQIRVYGWHPTFHFFAKVADYTPDYSQCGVWVRYVICMSMCRSTTYNNSKCCVYQYQYSVMLLFSTRSRAHVLIQSWNIFRALNTAGSTACDPLRVSSTATFATHLHSHERLTRAFDLLLLAPASASWLQNHVPSPAHKNNFHSTPGELHCPVCRPAQ